MLRLLAQLDHILLRRARVLCRGGEGRVRVSGVGCRGPAAPAPPGRGHGAPWQRSRRPLAEVTAPPGRGHGALWSAPPWRPHPRASTSAELVATKQKHRRPAGRLADLCDLPLELCLTLRLVDGYLALRLVLGLAQPLRLGCARGQGQRPGWVGAARGAGAGPVSRAPAAARWAAEAARWAAKHLVELLRRWPAPPARRPAGAGCHLDLVAPPSRGGTGTVCCL